jgi:hypothetical protein
MTPLSAYGNYAERILLAARLKNTVQLLRKYVQHEYILICTRVPVVYIASLLYGTRTVVSYGTAVLVLVLVLYCSCTGTVENRGLSQLYCFTRYSAK